MPIPDTFIAHLRTLKARDSWRVHELPTEFSTDVLHGLLYDGLIEFRLWEREPVHGKVGYRRSECFNFWISKSDWPIGVGRLEDILAMGEDKPELSPELRVSDGGKGELARRAVQPDMPQTEATRDRVVPADTPNAVHNADFTMVNWYGTEYGFALGVQSSTVKALWEEWEMTGLGLHQKTIRDAVDPERDPYRIDIAFRDHPAFDTMIQRCGNGRYKLAPPSAEPPPPMPTSKKKKR